MQSSSKKRTLNYEQPQKYDLPFYSTEAKDRKVIGRLLLSQGNPQLTGLKDGMQYYELTKYRSI